MHLNISMASTNFRILTVWLLHVFGFFLSLHVFLMCDSCLFPVWLV